MPRKDTSRTSAGIACHERPDSSTARLRSRHRPPAGPRLRGRPLPARHHETAPERSRPGTAAASPGRDAPPAPFGTGSRPARDLPPDVLPASGRRPPATAPPGYGTRGLPARPADRPPHTEPPRASAGGIPRAPAGAQGRISPGRPAAGSAPLPGHPYLFRKRYILASFPGTV